MDNVTDGDDGRKRTEFINRSAKVKRKNNK